MALKAAISFKQIMTVVKSLTPSQKALLVKELSVPSAVSKKPSSFTELLLSGPVYTKKQINIIENNRKSITKWRTKKVNHQY